MTGTAVSVSLKLVATFSGGRRKTPVGTEAEGKTESKKKQMILKQKIVTSVRNFSGIFFFDNASCVVLQLQTHIE